MMGAYSAVIGCTSCCEPFFQASMTSARCAHAFDPWRGDKYGENRGALDSWFISIPADTSLPICSHFPKAMPAARALSLKHDGATHIGTTARPLPELAVS